ncbi:MAG: adenylyltransferase/cytidyltransferase family protein [Candidatus Gottesmanbacteria bacterium]|nr:adenylyltransferase/cytidyltransferase family protein [Candidatus Gottesmanbacteria bacterium]
MKHLQDESVNKDDEKRTVLVGGCFDLLHYGHIRFLEEAKKLGDHLVVALESDENVRKKKGESRPIHTQEQRKTMLESLSCVDEVIALPVMNTHQQYFDLVERVHPQIIAITQGDPVETNKREQATKIDAELVVVSKVPTPSTSQLAKLLGLE